MSEEILIESVKRHEILYNAQCEEYRDSDKRQAAWEEVSRLYGKSIQETKEDWHKLRKCHSNAMKRRKRKRLAPWRLEDKMSFLKQSNEEDHTNTKFLKLEDYSEDEYAEVSEYLESISSSDGTQTPNMSQTNNILHDTSTSNKIKTDPINISTEIESKKYKFDDTDHFFLSMSKMVKNLPKMHQLHIKLNLHKAINHVELKLLQDIL